MRRTTIILAALFLASASVAVEAHPGGLDGKGCHTNRKTGEYHCHRAQAAPEPQRAVPASSSNDGGEVKMSKSGICHDPSSPWYSQTKSYTPYRSMEACIRAGGRPPRG